MSLAPPTPGLTPPKRFKVVYDANRPSKTSVNVPPGDVLEVSAEVARQLQAADSHFKSDEPIPPRPPAEEEPEVEAAPEPDEDNGNVCGECGFEAKTPGGLASHQRKHS